MTVTVRPKAPGDAGRIVEIVRGLPEWFTPGAVEQVAGDAAVLPGFVAVEGGVVRGFILLEERGCCVEIAWLAVERGWRGRGIGSLLVAAAEEYACSRGRRVLTVKTYGGGDYEPYRETAGFYERAGFKLYEVIESYGPFGGQPAAVYVKPLDCRGEGVISGRGALYLMLAEKPIDLSKLKAGAVNVEALRLAIIAELDAVSLYEQLAAAVTRPEVREILLDVAGEEKTHVGEFLELLLRLDEEQARELAKGREEVEEIIGKK